MRPKPQNTEAIDDNSSKKEDMLNVPAVQDARKSLDVAPTTPDGLPKTEEEEAAEKRRLADERRHPPGIGTY